MPLLETIAVGSAIAGAIASAGSAVSAISAGTNNKRIAKWQDKWNREYMEIQQGYQQELMAQQAKINRENWAMENEYNLPIHIRERLMDAGINPNFSDALGSAGAASSSIAPVSGGSAPNISPPDLSAIQSSNMQQAQALASAGQTLSDSGLKLAQTENVQLSNADKNIELKYKDQLMSGAVDMQNVQIHYGKKLSDSEEVNCSNLIWNGILLSKNCTMLDKNIEQATKNIQLSEQELTNAKQQLINLQKQGNVLDQQANLFENEAAYQYQQSETAKALRPLQEQLMSVQVDEIISQKDLNTANARLADLQGIKEKALAAYYRAGTELEKANAMYVYKQAEYQEILNKYSPAMLSAQIDNYIADTGLKGAQAQQASEMAGFLAQQALTSKLNNDYRQINITIPHLPPPFNQVPVYIAQGVISMNMDLNKLQNISSVTNYTNTQIDWAAWNNSTTGISNMVNAASNAINAVKPVPSVPAQTLSPWTNPTMSTPMMYNVAP